MIDLNYKTIETASEMTGLSQIKLHMLRIAGIVSTRIERNWAGKRIPMYNMEDIVRWLENNLEKERDQG